MRVVLEAYWWGSGTQSLRHAVEGMVKTWLNDYPEDEVVVVGRWRDRHALRAALPSARVVTTRVWPQALSASLVVPLVARRLRATGMVVHNFSPVFGRGRTVLIHDLIFVTNPEWFTGLERLYFRPMVWTARRAHVLLATTRTEEARIRQFTRASRTAVVGFGLGSDVLGRGQGQPLPDLTPGSYVLTVGRLNARKNLDRLVDGALRSGRLSRETPLVIVGEEDGAWSGLLDGLAQRVRDGHIRFTGFLEQPQVTWLLQNCALFVALSLDEGFGLPPIEARALGAEVLVSDRAVFRETLEDTAVFVEPTDVEAIARAIDQALSGSGSSRPDSAQADRDKLLGLHNWHGTVRRIRDAVAST